MLPYLCESEAELLRVYIKLDELQALLSLKRFLRGHLCYIVNLDPVSAPAEDHGFLMQNGAKVPIRQRHQWVNGEPFSYSNWASGEPNNQNGREHYLLFNQDGSWNDIPDESWPFVCEWDSATAISDPANTVPTDHRYAFFSSAATWEAAKNFCESMGGHLITITSTEEQNLVNSLLSETSKKYLWIGATDDQKEGDWRWITGEKFQYSNWADSEPNNWHGIEHYAGLAARYVVGDAVYYQGEWNDFSNDGSTDSLDDFGFICEWDSSIQTPTDGPSAWAVEEVNKARDLGLIPSEIDGKYQTNITRAEFARLAIGLIEAKTGASVKEFLLSKYGVNYDVKFNDTNDYYALAANELGIVSGYGDGLFKPENSITREEAAVMLMRTANKLGITTPNGSDVAFSDSDQISAWAKDAVSFISASTDITNNTKVMNGTGNNMFSKIELYP